MAKLKTVIGFRVDDYLLQDLLKVAEGSDISTSEFCRQMAEFTVKDMDFINHLRHIGDNLEILDINKTT